VSENKVTARFDRIAWIYDLMESPMEWMSVSDWRRELIGAVSGKVLEIGVGTGKNIPYYPPETELTGVDISPKMLKRAQGKAKALGMNVEFSVMDIEQMTFPDESFDYVVSTFVFCSVPDPVRGLQEVRRVLRKQGTTRWCSPELRNRGNCPGPACH
jgi:ubiquinone/menaquinone biosynthesis C-methylase UbiE